MTLPTSRNTTYTSANPVKSTDLNAIQDCIIAGKHGDLVWAIPPTAALTYLLCAYNAAGYVASTGVSAMAFPLSMMYPGRRLKKIEVSLYGSGAGNNTLSVEKITSAGVVSNLSVVSGTTVTTPPASWAVYTLDLTDYTVATGEALQFIVSQQNTHRCGIVRVTADCP